MRTAVFSALLALPLLAAGPSEKPQVKFTTSLGSFTLQLEPKAAPKTVANFMKYVHKGFYKGTTFHRVIPTFMIQGGGFTADMKKKAGDPPIANEGKEAMAAGLHNTRGTIAMARTNDPHSASSQFFINVKDNSMSLDPKPDGWGYCVFGSVIEGMDTVDKIKAVPTHNVQMNGDVPVTAVLITDAQEVNGVPVKKPSAKKASPKATKKKR
ncbi:MAG: peptidyl-prolyl cis-trans isomerase [Holophagaceae bacterium]|nr:peptidyl-prolyl cis-trans isomerase [Holophagaceae bacterium]